MSNTHLEPHRQSPATSKEPAEDAAASKKPNIFARLYGTLGFKKGYNFVLWFIFGGAMFGFCLARFMYLHPPTMLSGIAPGEKYWFRKGAYKIGMLVHLASVLPAGLIAVTQFVPAIRYRVLIVHRILGYTALFFLFLGTGSAFAIMRRSFGGDIALQMAVVVVGAMTLVSAMIAWVNIKRLQIDQHRKWMLRTWFYAGSIITIRIVMIISARIVSAIGQYYTVWSCDEIAYTLDNNSTKIAEQYPVCLSDPTAHIAVLANWSTRVPIGSTLRTSFGAAGWFALILHAIGVEIYIHLTPGETSRLRKVSYQKQMEHGMSCPGSMGTVADRLGDNFGVVYKPE